MLYCGGGLLLEGAKCFFRLLEVDEERSRLLVVWRKDWRKEWLATTCNPLYSTERWLGQGKNGIEGVFVGAVLDL